MSGACPFPGRAKVLHVWVESQDEVFSPYNPDC